MNNSSTFNKHLKTESLKGYSVVSATGNVSVCMCTCSTIMFKTCLMIFYTHTHSL